MISVITGTVFRMPAAVMILILKISALFFPDNKIFGFLCAEKVNYENNGERVLKEYGAVSGMITAFSEMMRILPVSHTLAEISEQYKIIGKITRKEIRKSSA